MKVYTNKSNARRAAVTAIAKGENLSKEEVSERADEFFTIEGKKPEFSWRRVSTTTGGMKANTAIVDDDIKLTSYQEEAIAAVEEVFESNEDLETKLEAALDLNDAFDEPVIGHFIYCPHCKVHLGNGVIDNLQHFEDQPRNLENDPKEVKEFLKGMIEGTTHEFNCLACGQDFGEPLTLEMPGKGIKIEKNREEQNGITRPSVGGKCAAIWDACDLHYAETGSIPMPKIVKEWAASLGWNVNNTVIELYQWRKFMGFVGRQK